MGTERETTQVIRRLRLVRDSLGDKQSKSGARTLQTELSELIDKLASIDATFERQERVQPGDGPAEDARQLDALATDDVR